MGNTCYAGDRGINRSGKICVLDLQNSSRQHGTDHKRKRNIIKHVEPLKNFRLSQTVLLPAKQGENQEQEHSKCEQVHMNIPEYGFARISIEFCEFSVENSRCYGSYGIDHCGMN